MGGWVRSAILVAITASVVWFVRGDAQTAQPVTFGDTVQIVCEAGDITGVTIAQTDMQTFELLWVAIDESQAPYNGVATFGSCVISPDSEPTPQDGPSL